MHLPISTFKNVVILLGRGLHADDLGNWYSCHFLSIPTIKALSKIFGGEITLVTDKEEGELYFSHIPHKKIIDLHWKVNNCLRGFDADKVGKEVGECDLFICLNSWNGESGLNVKHLLGLLSPVLSLGFHNFFMEKIPYTTDNHYSELLFNFALYFDPLLLLSDYMIKPSIPVNAGHIASEIIEDYRALGGRILTIVPDVSTPRKAWQIGHYQEVIRNILDKHPHVGIILLFKKECPLALSGNDRLLVLEHVPSAVSLAFVALSDFFLGVESDALHIADVFGVPGVGIFGMLSPTEWAGFRFTRNISLSRQTVNLSEITPAEVVDAFDELLLL